MKVIASATVGDNRWTENRRDVITNRVRMRAAKVDVDIHSGTAPPVLSVVAPPVVPRDPPALEPRTAPVRSPSLERRRGKTYLKDPNTRGRAYKTICISIPVDDLAAIDAEAKRLKMARSDLLRTAALQIATRKTDG